MSSELVLKKVDTILANCEIPDRHTFFQLKNFIIGKEYTVQGQLWQVVREIKSRKDSLDALDLQIANAEDDLDLIDIRKECIDNDRLTFSMHSDTVSQIRIRECEIHKRKLEREKQALQKNIDSLKAKSKYILEEVAYLVNAFDTLSQVQPMKPLDDVASQKQYWNEKLATHLNLKLLLKNPLDSEFVNTILALDDDSPVKQYMVGMLDKVQKHMIEERDRQRALASEAETARLNNTR